MNNGEMRQKVFELVSQIMEIPVDEVSEKSSSDTVATWDSMTQMGLTLALQEQFQVKIPGAQAAKLSNVKLILAALEEQLKAK